MTPEALSAPERAKEFFSGKLDFTIDPAEVNQQIENGGSILIIDVRATEDFLKGHVPRAINLPDGHWNNTSGWRKELSHVVYCYSQTCHLAAHAAIAFASQRYSVMEMEGGFETWKKNKFPVEI
jgi:rhodanese-related sulfurtransferase